MVVLLHGLTAAADLNWFGVFDGLGGAGFRVLSVEHRGYAGGRPLVAAGAGWRTWPTTWWRWPTRWGWTGSCPSATRWGARWRSWCGAGIRVGWRGWCWGRPPPCSRCRCGSGCCRGCCRRPRSGGGWRRRWRAGSWGAPSGPGSWARRWAGWADAELARHRPSVMLAWAAALGRFSSAPWIGGVDVPTAVVVTSRDVLVPTRPATGPGRGHPGGNRRRARRRPRRLRHRPVGVRRRPGGGLPPGDLRPDPSFGAGRPPRRAIATNTPWVADSCHLLSGVTRCRRAAPGERSPRTPPGAADSCHLSRRGPGAGPSHPTSDRHEHPLGGGLVPLAQRGDPVPGAHPTSDRHEHPLGGGLVPVVRRGPGAGRMHPASDRHEHLPAVADSCHLLSGGPGCRAHTRRAMGRRPHRGARRGLVRSRPAHRLSVPTAPARPPGPLHQGRPVAGAG